MAHQRFNYVTSLARTANQFDQSETTSTPAGSFYPPKEGIYVKDNVTINVINSTYISLVFASGIVIRVSRLPLGFLLMSQQVPHHLQRYVSGLLGDWNGNPYDDLRVYGGSPISGKAPLQPTHNSYGMSCKPVIEDS